MSKILLSINPKHVENIFLGIKRYEFRKVKCKEKVDEIIIYETSPIMKIVGKADVVDVLTGQPDDVWRITSKYSGIDKNFYDSYFENCDTAIAYQLSNVKKYKKPKDLSDYGLKAAPQSFVYI